MLQVILDTNILDRSPYRKNAEFQALHKLCDSGKIQLHLSEVVQREFLAHREQAIEEGLQLIARGLRKLDREKAAKHAQFSEFLSWKSNLEGLKSQFIYELHNEFSQWLESLKIQVHEVAPHHGKATIDAYFRGNAPFQGNRSKAEFADAFIWQSLLDILQDKKDVHFVTNNTKDFLELCNQTSGVTLYPSLGEFLISPRVKRLFLEQFTEQNFEVIISALLMKEADILPVIIRKVSKALSWVDSSFVQDLVEPSVNISNWGYSAERDWTVEIQYDQARHYGYGNISLPIIVRIEGFNVGYSKTIYEIPEPLPPNTEMHSAVKSGQATVLITDDYFPLLLYSWLDIYLPTDEREKLTLENIPKFIDLADINVEQIDFVEADETKRKRYHTIM